MIKTKGWFAFFGLISFILVAVSAHAQTDVALSLYGAFNGSTTGNGTQQSPSNSAGGLIELRHISHPWMGYDVTYSYNRDNQSILSVPNACPAFGCSISTESVKANAHEITADWVASLHIANLRPFGLAGIGLLLNVPATSQATVTTTGPCEGLQCCPQCATGSTVTTTSTSATQTSTKPVFVYGAGLDWGFLPHLGLRVQYRGNLYKAPDLSKLFTSTGAFTHSSEPMIGAYFRF